MEENVEKVLKKKIKIKCKKKKKRHLSALSSPESHDTAGEPVASAMSLTVSTSEVPSDLQVSLVSESQHSLIPDLLEEKKVLKNCVESKDVEIACLQKQVADLNDVINGCQISMVGRGSNIISSKIIQLMKRNRALCSEVETYKTNFQKNMEEISKLRRALDQRVSEKPETPPEPPVPSKSDIEVLKSEISQTKTKLFETMNANVGLRNEIRFLQKCLQEEIGPEPDIRAPGWKGRAQQILALQAKVSQLAKSGPTEHSEDKIALAKLECKRRQEVQMYQRQCEDLKEAQTQLQEKVSALKIRNRNLMDEVALSKKRVEELVMSSKETEKYVASLNAQISKLKVEFESKEKDYIRKLVESEKNQESFKVQLEQLKLMNENKEMLIEGRKDRIQELESTLVEMQADLRLSYGDFLFNCRNLSREQYLGVLSCLEREKVEALKQMENFNFLFNQEVEKNIRLQKLVQKQQLQISTVSSYGPRKSPSKDMRALCRKNKPESGQTSISGEVESENLRLQLELNRQQVVFLKSKLKEVLAQHEEQIKGLSRSIQSSKDHISEILEAAK